jgi:ankyrin repeat protein
LQSIFELLKRYGPLDINGKDSRQETALLVACQTRSDKLIHVLLQYGADPNIVSDHDNDSPIHSILRRFRASSPANPQEHGQHLYDQSIIKQLMKHGADPNIKSRDGFSALDIATTKYDGKNLVLLLQRPNVQPAINK